MAKQLAGSERRIAAAGDRAKADEAKGTAKAVAARANVVAGEARAIDKAEAADAMATEKETIDYQFT